MVKTKLKVEIIETEKDTQGQIETALNHKKTTNQFFVIILFIFTIVACDSGKVYDNFYKVDKAGWQKDSLAIFEFEILDTTINYDLFISSRNLEKYSYSNLWLFVDIVAPDSTFIRDTVEYQMAEPNGKWIGKGTGGIYFIQNNYRTNIYFPNTGKYQIIIQHGMRDEKLKGLKNIGLRVAKR